VVATAATRTARTATTAVRKGQPLISIEAIIDLIGSTTTTSGLKALCVKDENTYEIGIKVSDDDFEKITIKRETICPDWNYIF
jgi:hypothetical protein